MKKLREILKYIPLTLVIPFFILSFFVYSSETIIVGDVEKKVITYYLQVPKRFDIPAADTIIALSPMVFTIITISLSLSPESILGVKNTMFRRARKDYHFRFIEMIVITIIIFVLFTAASILSKTAIIWILDAVSVYYLLRFVFQEIPLLVQNEMHLLKIVKRNWRYSKRDLKNGQISKTSELQKIIKYIILSQGIKETYLFMCYKKKSKKGLNNKMLDDLLSHNNDFLFNCIMHKDYLSKNNINCFDEIDLQKSIDVSLDSLVDIFSFSNEFNICEIYGDTDHYYQVTRMIFGLKILTNKLSMNDGFDQKIGICLNFIFLPSQKNDDLKKKFIDNFLKAMIKYSISSNEIWFISLLRETVFCRKFLSDNVKSYFIFISIYFYYIISIDKKVPEELKEQIFKFFDEPSKGINSDGSNWFNVIKHQVEYSNYNEIVGLLPKLLDIYGEKHIIEPWYCPENRHSWCSDEGVFDKSLIIKCWLELLVYSYHSYDFREKDTDIVIDALNESDKMLFAQELGRNWFVDTNFIGIDKTNTFLSLYKIREIQKKEDCYETLTKYLYEKKQDIILLGIKGDSEDNNLNYKEVKDHIIERFDLKKKEINLFYNELIITSKQYHYYNLKIEKNNWNENVNFHIDCLCDVFRKIIYNEVEKEVKSEVLIRNTKTLENIQENYDYRSDDYYDLYDLGCDKNIIKKINNIKETNVELPKLLFFKSNAIRFNVDCDDDKTFVRSLNPNEIDSIIDNDYKVTEGLYKFNNGDDTKSVFVDRRKISEIVSEKYLIACIFFKYEVYLDKNNIKRYKINNDDDED